jgi:hypothetical protein
MNYELEVFICDESQGIESGTSFHDCIRELFTVTHHVPEQFTPDYVSVILKCLHEISCKIAEDYDYGDLSYEMDGEVTASGFVEGHWQMDKITVVFREGKENVSN